MYLSKFLTSKSSFLEKKWLAAGIDWKSTLIPFWELNLLSKSVIYSSGTNSSFLP